MSKIKIVRNKLLRGWFIVLGAHQTPISGRFERKADAAAWLERQRQGIRRERHGGTARKMEG